MLSQYLQSVTGIQELGIVSLIGAVALFTVAVVYALRLDSGVLRARAMLPLEDDTPTNEPAEGRRP